MTGTLDAEPPGRQVAIGSPERPDKTHKALGCCLALRWKEEGQGNSCGPLCCRYTGTGMAIVAGKVLRWSVSVRKGPMVRAAQGLGLEVG